MATLEIEIQAINATLERVSIRQKKGRFYLRLNNPPIKPGESEPRDRVEIAVGCYANKEGLKMAVAKAQEINSQLVWGRFQWDVHIKKHTTPQSCGDWIEAYKIAHWGKVRKTPTTENSFYKDYLQPFSKLEQDAPLTLERLRGSILALSETGSRSRKRFALAYRLLGEFAQVEGASSLNELGKGYGLKTVQSRELPNDEEIAIASGTIKNPAWRWVFQVMAVYGIRPHEAFRLRFDRFNEDPALIEVTEESKTGRRLVFPCAGDDWQFNLENINLPKIKTDRVSNNAIGGYVSRAFKRENVGFHPYDLRHCYARRWFEKGATAYFTARCMGHSVVVHEKSYGAWWGEESMSKVFESLRQKD